MFTKFLGGKKYLAILITSAWKSNCKFCVTFVEYILSGRTLHVLPCLMFIKCIWGIYIYCIYEKIVIRTLKVIQGNTAPQRWAEIQTQAVWIPLITTLLLTCIWWCYLNLKRGKNKTIQTIQKYKMPSWTLKGNGNNILILYSI